MNVTFGLIAAWIAVCLGALGVKGKGYSLEGAGSQQFEKASWGGTLVNLLRGSWPYSVQTVPGFGGVPSTPVPNPNYKPGAPYGGGIPTSPEPPTWLVPVDPNAPTAPGFPETSLQAPPPAGSVTV